MAIRNVWLVAEQQDNTTTSSANNKRMYEYVLSRTNQPFPHCRSPLIAELIKEDCRPEPDIQRKQKRRPKGHRCWTG